MKRLLARFIPKKFRPSVHRLADQAIAKVIDFPGIGQAVYRRKVQDLLRAPQQLNIEITSYCNARCIMCPRQDMRRKMEVMPWPLYQKIIDEAAQAGVKYFALNGYGEIFTTGRLYRQFIDYINEKIHQPRIIINTNGSRMNAKVAQYLIDAKVYAVNIDIDGSTKETFESVRLDLSYDDVRGNAEHLLKLKRDKGAEYPLVRIGMIVQPKNRHEIEDHRQQWQGQADFVGAEIMVNRAGSVAVEGEQHQDTPCFLLWAEMTVLSDGGVALCCDDWDGKLVLGNLKTEGLLDVWGNKRYQAIRQMHLDGKNTMVSLCKECNYSRPGPVWFQQQAASKHKAS